MVAARAVFPEPAGPTGRKNEHKFRRRGSEGRRTVKEDGDEGSTLRSADLLDEELAVAEDALWEPMHLHQSLLLRGKRKTEKGREKETHPDMLVKVNDAVLNRRLKLLLVNTESRLDFVESVEEVFAADLHLVDVVREGGEGTDLRRAGRVSKKGSEVPRVGTHLDMAVEGETRSTLDETTDLSSREVLCQARELRKVHVAPEYAVRPHLARVDRQDLNTTGLVGKGDLDVDLETSRTEERLVDHVHSIRHSDEQDVVELIDSVHLLVRSIVSLGRWRREREESAPWKEAGSRPSHRRRCRCLWIHAVCKWRRARRK